MFQNYKHSGCHLENECSGPSDEAGRLEPDFKAA